MNEEIKIKNGVRDGDALSATLFNAVLKGIVRETGYNWTITQRGTQIIAYADDIVLIARTKLNTEEIKTGEKTFQKVVNFEYLGLMVNGRND